MHDLTRLMIAGPTKPAGSLQVTAPYDGSTIAEVATGNEQHVDAALAVAHDLYRNRGSWIPLHERIGILQRVADIMAGQKEELTLLAASEGGKPFNDSMVEINRAIDGIGLCMETLKSDPGHVIPMRTTASSTNRLAFTQKEPIGVVVAVSAFNHPLNLIVHQVAAAIAAGCPTVVKPANDTPLSCLRFVQILREAGLPDGWCQVLVANNRETSEKLVTDARVGFFSFIGSAAVGWYLRSKVAPGVRCALEHGGVAPVILCEDAGVDDALASLSKGGFYHAGQVCVSVQRVFVPASMARTFAEGLAARAEKLVIGDPTSPETEVGPLIRPAEVTRVHEWVEEAIASGAERLCGGQAISESCYPCTVLLDPPDAARVSSSEVFGPVVCVYSYDKLDEAIERANALPVSFQAAVYTSDLDTMLKTYRQIDASAVMVNDHTAFRIDGMPFAGLRESGLAVGGIPYTIEDMQIEKMLVIKSGEL
ncbi:MAG: aldehyde dehydrogenase family protein [Gammaproteobacteria bacterium]